MNGCISILQIADLHRDPQNPIRNDALLNSLENDSRRYASAADAPIRPPDIIVVSGDVIQGTMPGAADPGVVLDAQHREALEFLSQLTDRFLDGNRQRVVIVPGNHDVSACHFIASVQRVNIAVGRKTELVSQLFSSNSVLRWSWSDFELFEIADPGMYERRLEPFGRFYEEFYRGTRTYHIDPAKQFDIFDFPEFNLTIVGFSSCFNNDILNKQGAIHPGCIGEVGNRLRHSNFSDRLLMAVWHHNTEGGPTQFDYMDADILQNLIDCGFSLGLHGHQHRPQFLDTRFRYGGDRRITVISAGTLCGSAAFRFARAYNIIELNTHTHSGRVHVREMQNDDLQLPIWGRRALPPGASAFLQFMFDPPVPPVVRLHEPTIMLVQAQALYEQREYGRAIELLDKMAATDGLARRLLLECLARVDDTAGIASRFDPPESETEAIYLMEALWRQGRRERLRSLLAEPIISASTDPSVAEVRTKYSTRLNR